MAFEFKTLRRPGATPAALVVAEEKLWLTEDKEQLVPDGDPAAAFLFCTPGDELPVEEAERYGLVRKQAAKPSAKQSAKPAAKQRKKAEAKSG